jgi:hypothetical protein
MLLFASIARANDSQSVVVLGVGVDGAPIASAIASHLQAPYASIDAGPFRAALGTAVRLLPQAARRHDKDAELLVRARAAARSAHADEAIVVYGERSRKALVLHVWAIDARGSGSALVDQEVRLGAHASAGDGADAAWSAVAAQFPPQAEEPPPPPAPVAAERPSTPSPAPASPAEGAAGSGDAAATAAAGAPRSPSTRATSIAILQASVEGGTRHFSYVDRLTPTLRPYDLFVAPLLAIHGEVYPFTNMHVPVVSGLGATGTYARAIGLSSKDSQGDRVDTSWQSFDLGLRERLRLGDSFVLGIDAGYAGNDFTFGPAVTPASQLPSAAYELLRAGLDGRLTRGALDVHAAASYLDVLSAGEFGKLFPRATVGGIEAGLGVSDTFAPSFELSLDVVYTRFFYSLLPQPGDPSVAGGALDQMGTVSLSFAHFF